MASKRKAGWESEAVADFERGDMLILGDDGEQAHFVPLLPPDIRTEEAFGSRRQRAHVMVARCGDGEVEAPALWYVQLFPIGKRLFRSYRRAAAMMEGKVLLRLTRCGASGDTGTRYTLDVVSEKMQENAEAVGVLAALKNEAEEIRDAG